MEYEVTAELSSPGVGVLKHGKVENLTTSATVLFAPRKPLSLESECLVVSDDSKPFTFKSSALAAGKIVTEKSPQTSCIRNRPRLDFEVTVGCSTMAEAGSEVCFKVSFIVRDKTPNVARIPAVHIKIRKLLLVDTTYARAPRD